MSRSPLDRLSTLVERVSTMCRSTYGPIVYRHSTDKSTACQSHSIGMSVECRSRVPLVHMILLCKVFFSETSALTNFFPKDTLEGGSLLTKADSLPLSFSNKKTCMTRGGLNAPLRKGSTSPPPRLKLNLSIGRLLH